MAAEATIADLSLESCNKNGISLIVVPDAVIPIPSLVSESVPGGSSNCLHVVALDPDGQGTLDGLDGDHQAVILVLRNQHPFHPSRQPPRIRTR